MDEFDRLFSMSGLSLERMRSFLLVAEAGNLANAAKGDVTRQSQFSRQIKELETFFGVPLTRRIGRRIEITPEGVQLGLMIRRQFGELHGFRESMAGRSVNIRFGSQGSVIQWLLVPRLSEIRAVLGNVLVEMEQMRSHEVVRAVSDGRLDFGIVRGDAVPDESKRWRLGSVGYALFAAIRLWEGCSTVEEMLQKAPIAELLPGGQFAERWEQWIAERHLRPQRFARVSSFSELAKVVQAGSASAVLPDLAAIDFDPKRFAHRPIPGLRHRAMVLIANARGLERSGVAPGVATKLAHLLKLG